MAAPVLFGTSRPGSANPTLNIRWCYALVAIKDWTFLLGPALILGANSLLRR